jgi:WD40 repeat protein
MTDLFISYSRKDLTFVQQLYDKLKEANRDIWIDLEDIPPTAAWMQEIQAGIEGANAFVFVISPDSVVSEVCRMEIEHAVKNNKRLIPILHRDVPDRSLIHPSLASHNWLFFRENDNFERAYNWLINALDTDLGFARMHTRLLVRSIEWEDRKRDDSYLLRGTDLTEAENWLASSMGKRPEPTQLQTQYIFASRRAASTRQRNTLVGVTFGFVVSLALAVLALILYQQARDARQRAEESQGTAVAALISVNDTRATAQAQEESFRATINALDINRPVPSLDDPSGTGGDSPESTLTELAFAPTIVETALATQGVNAFPTPTPYNPEATAEEVELEEDSTVELLLRVENYRRADTPERRAFARSELLSTLQNQVLIQSTSLTGHNGAVQDVAYSPNGQILASASDDNSIILWDANTLERIGLPFYGHQAGVTGIEFSSNGQNIASSSRDGTVIIWDIASGQIVRQLTGHANWVLGVAYSPNGNLIASASGDGTIILWDAANGTNLRTLTGHNGSVFSIAFSPDGQTLASGGSDGLVILWGVESGAETQRLEAHQSAVFTVAFSPDGRTLASGGGDNIAIIWGVEQSAISRTGVQPIYTLIGPTRAILGLGYSPDSSTLAVGTAENVVMLWDVATAQPIGNPLTGYRDWVYSITFSPDGQTLASGSSDGSIVLWSVNVDRWIAQACTAAGRSLTGEEWESLFPGEEYRETCAGI